MSGSQNKKLELLNFINLLKKKKTIIVYCKFNIIQNRYKRPKFKIIIKKNNKLFLLSNIFFPLRVNYFR